MPVLLTFLSWVKTLQHRCWACPLYLSPLPSPLAPNYLSPSCTLTSLQILVIFVPYPPFPLLFLFLPPYTSLSETPTGMTARQLFMTIIRLLAGIRKVRLKLLWLLLCRKLYHRHIPYSRSLLPWLSGNSYDYAGVYYNVRLTFGFLII